MQPTFMKLRSAALRHIFREPARLDMVCERSWTIAPSEAIRERPAIFLDGELEHVKAAQEETTLEAEFRRVRGGVRHHAATRAFLLKDARVVGGRVFRKGMNLPLSRMSDGPNGEPTVRMPSAAVASTLMGSIYFGHWLHDDLTLQLATDALAPAIGIARQSYHHETGYRSLLGLAAPRHVAHGLFGQLILLHDWGQNADKRRRYDELRRRLRERTPGQGNELVYIRRGSSRAGSGRELVDAQALEDQLAARGFAIVDPGALSPTQIAEATRDAKVVVGLEGSHLAHAVYSIAAGGTLVALQPPQRFNNVFKDITDAMDLHYAFLVGKAVDGGFTIDTDRLARLLDKIAAT